MIKKLSLFLLSAVLLLGSLSAVRAETFTAYLNGAQQVPVAATSATGYARIVVNESAGTVSWTVVYNNLTSAQNAAHIHAPGAIGVNAGVAIGFAAPGGTSGTITGSGVITPTQIAQLRAHLGYVNVHSANFPNGEIRGQLGIDRPVDFDGDGRQDYSILRFPTGPPRPITYYNYNSTTGVQIANWGEASTDFPVPGDYDGDAIGDLAVYRAGLTATDFSHFYVFRSADNTVQVTEFGVGGDQAVCRDYDGDGKTDVAIYRRGATPTSLAEWWIRQSTDGQNHVITWGITGDSVAGNGDTPVPGDYDGDGKFDVAVYRFGGLAPNNTFIVFRSSDSAVTFTPWGDFNTDFIVPGDYDGDGKFDYVAARTGPLASSPMVWWILQSSDNQVRRVQWGISSDVPVQGDYDGDARTDVAVYRQGAVTGAASTFWVFRSFDLTALQVTWGLRGDFPVASFDAR